MNYNCIHNCDCDCRGESFIACSVRLFKSGRLGDLVDVDVCNSLDVTLKPLYTDEDCFIDCSGIENTGKHIGTICLPDYTYQMALQKQKSVLQMIMKDPNYMKELEGADKQ